jgi:branched-chain amino acid transport system substrate-binding protein
MLRHSIGRLTLMGRGRRLSVMVAVAGAAAIGVAGCGSSSSSSSTASASASSSAGSGGASASSSKTPYVVGAIASSSGPIASTVGQMGPTMTAWAKWRNANGGIDGHPVKMIVKDDAGNPSTALQDVKQMVTQDHIIALIPLSGTESDFGPYTKQVNIPVVGGLDSAVQYTTDSNWFSLGFNVVNATGSVMKLASEQGLKKAGVMYCAEVAACSEVIAEVAGLGKPLGVKVVSQSSISSTAADYTAPCLKAKSAGANFLYIAAAAQQQLNVATSCAQQQYKAPIFASAINFNNTWLKVPAANGSISTVPTFPYIDDSIPATQAFQSAMKQYAPSLLSSSSFGAANASAWTSGQLFAAAAIAGQMGNNPSVAGMFKGLYALHNETLGGLSGPINYVKAPDANIKNDCGFVMQVKDGKMIEPQGLKLICTAG